VKVGDSSVRRRIVAFSNPTIRLLRGLRDKRQRQREGRFLVEGLRLIEDARAGGRLPEMLVVAQNRAHPPLLAEIEAAVAAAGGEVIETSAEILAKIAGKDNPQAVCGVYAQWETGLAALDPGSARLWLVAQAMRDPGNLGTILRTGDAVGAGGLILIDDCADPFSAEAVRASMGAIFSQRVARARWPDFLGWLRGQDSQGRQPRKSGQLVAASLRDAVPYRGAPYASPCFILVGNESRGLPVAYEAACDLRVTMPMRGRADSLNAAIAAAVLAYEVVASFDG